MTNPKRTVADNVIRDPFTYPTQLIGANHLVKAIHEKVGVAAGQTLVVVTRASQPKNVIDAKEDARGCAACGESVWVSPSSRKVQHPVFVCKDCFLAVAATLPEPTEAERRQNLSNAIRYALEQGVKHYSVSGRLLTTEVEIMTAFAIDGSVEVERQEVCGIDGCINPPNHQSDHWDGVGEWPRREVHAPQDNE